MIPASSMILATSHQVSSDLAGEAVILELNAGEYFGLNPVGAFIWDLIQQAAFVELVRHSYVVHFLQATGAAAEHLRQTARLARSVPVARLRRQRSFGALPQVAALVEQDLA